MGPLSVSGFKNDNDKNRKDRKRSNNEKKGSEIDLVVLRRSGFLRVEALWATDLLISIYELIKWL
jgi:hypothetical protein